MSGEEARRSAGEACGGGGEARKNAKQVLLFRSACTTLVCYAAFS